MEALVMEVVGSFILKLSIAVLSHPAALIKRAVYVPAALYEVPLNK